MTYTTVDIKNKKEGQSISIPKNMMIDDDKVIIRKIGNALYLIPHKTPWKNMIDNLDAFTDDFMEERNQPTWKPEKHSFD